MRPPARPPAGPRLLADPAAHRRAHRRLHRDCRRRLQLHCRLMERCAHPGGHERRQRGGHAQRRAQGRSVGGGPGLLLLVRRQLRRAVSFRPRATALGVHRELWRAGVFQQAAAGWAGKQSSPPEKCCLCPCLRQASCPILHKGSFQCAERAVLACPAWFLRPAQVVINNRTWVEFGEVRGGRVWGRMWAGQALQGKRGAVGGR